jgi:hypothetical protein
MLAIFEDGEYEQTYIKAILDCGDLDPEEELEKLQREKTGGPRPIRVPYKELGWEEWCKAIDEWEKKVGSIDLLSHLKSIGCKEVEWREF